MSRRVDFPDLRKHMISADLPSPALGSVTCHVEVQRLFSHWLTSTQAEVTLADMTRVGMNYSYNRDFMRRVYDELKRNQSKLGAKELWITLSQHLDEIDDDVIKFVSDQIAFPHLYRNSQDRRGGKIYTSMEAIIVE